MVSGCELDRRKSITSIVRTGSNFWHSVNHFFIKDEFEGKRGNYPGTAHQLLIADRL